MDDVTGREVRAIDEGRFPAGWGGLAELALMLGFLVKGVDRTK